jgi:hypothetical protein
MDGRAPGCIDRDMLCVGAPHTFGQKLSFGVITGAHLTDDFLSLACPDLSVSQLAPPPGCPRFVGLAIGVANASRRFIIGPKVNLRFSPSLSLEVDALHREIRSHNTRTFLFCPPTGLSRPGGPKNESW